jgi:hypothetical protein
MSFLSFLTKTRNHRFFETFQAKLHEGVTQIFGGPNFWALPHFCSNLLVFSTLSKFYSTKVIVGVRTKEILDKLAKTPNFEQNVEFFGTFPSSFPEGA